MSLLAKFVIVMIVLMLIFLAMIGFWVIVLFLEERR